MNESDTLRGRAWVDGAIRDVTIRLAGSQIGEVIVSGRRATDGAIEDGLILPGFIDAHVHGAAGADFMDATRDAVETITRHHARGGTTTMTATTLSGSTERIRDAIQSIASAREFAPPDAAEIAGVHLEGPFINAAKAGAQDRASIRAADIYEVESWYRLAPHLHWTITVAPEAEGVGLLIDRFRDRISFSIGHTAATYAQTLDAIAAGATRFTHLFNAMPPLHHREPGVVGGALVSQSTWAELVADGHHVHPLLMRLVTEWMPGRIALVTDAIRACGMRNGTVKLYEHDVNVIDGVAKLADGTLAGSTLTMHEAVRNMIELATVPIETVIPLATEVPAKMLGLDKRKGRISEGYDADLVVLTPRLDIGKVFVRGRELSRT